MNSKDVIIDEDLRQKVDLISASKDEHLGKTLGIEFIQISKNLVSARMPVTPSVHQPFGILHGGASVALAETVASIAGWLQVDEAKYDVVGIEINANHLRSVRSGYITATAQPVKIGKTIQVWQIEICDDKESLTCSSRCTLMNVEKSNA